MGETTGDAGAGSWFLTNVARSVGWHKGTVKVGPALVDNTNQVDFSVDDILALSHNSKTAFGYNVLEFNTDFGAFTGYFDDAKFGTISQPTTVPEPSSLLLLLGGMAAMAFSRRCRRAF